MGVLSVRSMEFFRSRLCRVGGTAKWLFLAAEVKDFLAGGLIINHLLHPNLAMQTVDENDAHAIGKLSADSFAEKRTTLRTFPYHQNIEIISQVSYLLVRLSRRVVSWGAAWNESPTNV